MNRDEYLEYFKNTNGVFGNYKNEMCKDLNNILKSVIDFQVKYNIPPSQFIIDDMIIAKEIESGEMLFGYSTDGLTLFTCESNKNKKPKRLVIHAEPPTRSGNDIVEKVKNLYNKHYK